MIIWLSEEEFQRARLPFKTNCTYITPELAKKVGDLPGRTVFKSFFVEHKERWFDVAVDIALAEILYRLLPGKGVLSIAAQQSATLYSFTKQAKKDQAEVHLALSGFLEELSKGDLVAVPITNGTHWTLLMLERVERRHKTDTAIYINSLNSRDWPSIRQKAFEQFSTDCWPTSVQAAQWEVRYYDSLKGGHGPTREIAVWLLRYTYT